MAAPLRAARRACHHTGACPPTGSTSPRVPALHGAGQPAHLTPPPAPHLTRAHTTAAPPPPLPAPPTPHPTPPSPKPTKKRAASTAGSVSPAAATQGVMASAGSSAEARENQAIPAPITSLPAGGQPNGGGARAWRDGSGRAASRCDVRAVVRRDASMPAAGRLGMRGNACKLHRCGSVLVVRAACAPRRTQRRKQAGVASHAPPRCLASWEETPSTPAPMLPPHLRTCPPECRPAAAWPGTPKGRLTGPLPACPQPTQALGRWAAWPRCAAGRRQGGGRRGGGRQSGGQAGGRAGLSCGRRLQSKQAHARRPTGPLPCTTQRQHEAGPCPDMWRELNQTHLRQMRSMLQSRSASAVGSTTRA